MIFISIHLVFFDNHHVLGILSEFELRLAKNDGIGKGCSTGATWGIGTGGVPTGPRLAAITDSKCPGNGAIWIAPKLAASKSLNEKLSKLNQHSIFNHEIIMNFIWIRSLTLDGGVAHILEAWNAQDEAYMVDTPTKKPTMYALVIEHKVSNQAKMDPTDGVIADCCPVSI